jgi:hypothetical protein
VDHRFHHFFFRLAFVVIGAGKLAAGQDGKNYGKQQFDSFH